jgi:ElaB/YqjD/DUF883 family membrane-anchored ribosome-binding protein
MKLLNFQHDSPVKEYNKVICLGVCYQTNREDVTMQKTRKRTHHAAPVNFYSDLAKIKSALSHASNGVKTKTNDMILEELSSVRNKTIGIQDDFVDYVTDKPLKAVGYAILTGYLLGKFIL